jgi:predicted RNA-binding Zn-ribbon protein involved in translation (DUF1610 family)
MLARLRSVGMLRREKEPSWDLVSELFHSAAHRFSCSQCGATGMRVAPCEDDGADDAWGLERACVDCGQPIAAERVRLLPTVTLCITCQRAREVGQSADAPTYCPQCGSVMHLRLRSGGVARYEMACPECGRRDG